jgi:uracil-DNA glycosylase
VATLFDDPLNGRMPLYDPADVLRDSLARVAGMPRDRNCQRCPLGAAAKNPCLVGRDGSPGAPLVVGGNPTQHDDLSGFLLEQGLSAVVATAVKRAWAGDWRMVWAVGCPGPVEQVSIDACRPYLAAELAAGPQRVVLLGPVAAQAVIGVAIDARRLRRAWAEVRGVPCFVVQDVRVTAYNRHLRKWFDNDVQWAFQAPLTSAPRGEVRVALSAAEACTLLSEIKRGEALVVDGEWASSPWAKDFRMLCLGFCQDPDRPFVIPDQMVDQSVRDALRGVLEDPLVPKVNQWIKSDRHAIWRAYGVDMIGIEWDTMLASKLQESDAPAGLGALSWRIGMGGYKEIGQEDAEDEG